MKTILTLELYAIAFTLGLLAAGAYHAGDYSAGYAAGYAAPRPRSPEDRVVNGLLCKYAEVACPKTK